MANLWMIMDIDTIRHEIFKRVFLRTKTSSGNILEFQNLKNRPSLLWKYCLSICHICWKERISFQKTVIQWPSSLYSLFKFLGALTIFMLSWVDTAWKVSKYGVFSGRSIGVSSNAGKYGPEKTSYLVTFHAVWVMLSYIELFLPLLFLLSVRHYNEAKINILYL